MSDVNELAARRVFPIKLLSLFFTVVIAGYCGLVAMMPRGNPDIPRLSYDPSLLIGFAIVILFSPPVFLTLVSRYIDAAAGRPQSIVANLKVFFLTLFMYIGFPMVQQSMNDLIRRRGST